MRGDEGDTLAARGEDGLAHGLDPDVFLGGESEPAVGASLGDRGGEGDLDRSPPRGEAG